MDEAACVGPFDFFVALEQLTDFVAERLLPMEAVTALALLRVFCASPVSGLIAFKAKCLGNSMAMNSSVASSISFVAFMMAASVAAK